MRSVIVVIPARYASTRLPAKPLADIGGKPMIQWVYERSRQSSGVESVVVATDDERIVQVVESFGGQAIMTSSEIQSGTDRVAAVADRLHADIYINVQGDEPLIDPRAIEKVVQILKNSEYSMSTIMTPLRTLEELHDPSVVKVLADRKGRAIYFSRHPIPYSRGPFPKSGHPFGCWRHVGVYGYRRETLMQFRNLPHSALEKGEVLEQLRALDHGIPIGIAEVNFTSIGVDTPGDLEKVRQYLV